MALRGSSSSSGWPRQPAAVRPSSPPGSLPQEGAMTDEKQITLEAETGTVVHPLREYVTIVLTASLIVGAIWLSILLAFIVFFAPREAHGVERLKQKISVREQWLATCSHSPRREECYLYATGLTHALYIWRELAPLTARVCLPETWDNEQAVVATNALLRQYPDVGVPYAMMVAYASAYPCPQGQPPKTELAP